MYVLATHQPIATTTKLPLMVLSFPRSFPTAQLLQLNVERPRRPAAAQGKGPPPPLRRLLGPTLAIPLRMTTMPRTLTTPAAAAAAWPPSFALLLLPTSAPKAKAAADLLQLLRRQPAPPAAALPRRRRRGCSWCPFARRREATPTWPLQSVATASSGASRAASSTLSGRSGISWASIIADSSGCTS